MNRRDRIHRSLCFNQEKFEDWLILDHDMKDPWASWLFEAGDQFKKVYCFVLGHVWDGYIHNKYLHCVWCGKARVNND